MSTKKTAPAAPGKRKPLTPEEKAKRDAERAKKFEAIAAPRTRRALKAIGLIGNLSASGYVSTPDQVEKIRKALQTKLDETMARFSATKKSEDNFDL